MVSEEESEAAVVGVGAAGDAVGGGVAFSVGSQGILGRLAVCAGGSRLFGERRVADCSHDPETLPSGLYEGLWIFELQCITHGAYHRCAEVEHFFDVLLVDGSEVGRLVRPEIHPAEEGEGWCSGGLRLAIFLSRAVLPACPIGVLGIPSPQLMAGYPLARNNGPVPIHRLMPVPLALCDIITNDLVSPRAVTEAFTCVFPLDSLFFCICTFREEVTG